MLYCAFVISSFLDDWSGIDLDSAITYIQRCYVSIRVPSSEANAYTEITQSYEGGYGQTPYGEALGDYRVSYPAIKSDSLGRRNIVLRDCGALHGTRHSYIPAICSSLWCSA